MIEGLIEGQGEEGEEEEEEEEEVVVPHRRPTVAGERKTRQKRRREEERRLKVSKNNYSSPHMKMWWPTVMLELMLPISVTVGETETGKEVAELQNE